MFLIIEIIQVEVFCFASTLNSVLKDTPHILLRMLFTLDCFWIACYFDLYIHIVTSCKHYSPTSLWALINVWMYVFYNQNNEMNHSSWLSVSYNLSIHWWINERPLHTGVIWLFSPKKSKNLWLAKYNTSSKPFIWVIMTKLQTQWK
jgi:hypothetical protein